MAYVPALVAAVILFIILGFYRESLVPWDASPERAGKLLTGDEQFALLAICCVMILLGAFDYDESDKFIA